RKSITRQEISKYQTSKHFIFLIRFASVLSYFRLQAIVIDAVYSNNMRTSSLYFSERTQIEIMFPTYSHFI
ncbi:MAG: hypothetical protein LBI95_01070, partial [Holosporales bacterium]|nr:hypothetical protein [Holosporales bacterium]